MSSQCHGFRVFESGKGSADVHGFEQKNHMEGDIKVWENRRKSWWVDSECFHAKGECVYIYMYIYVYGDSQNVSTRRAIVEFQWKPEKYANDFFLRKKEKWRRTRYPRDRDRDTPMRMFEQLLPYNRDPTWRQFSRRTVCGGQEEACVICDSITDLWRETLPIHTWHDSSIWDKTQSYVTVW